MTEEVVADVRDEIELLETGRVRLTFDGTTITLREAKAGDLKKLKRSYYEIIEENAKLAPKERVEHEIDAWGKWLRAAVDTLGDAKLPAGKNGTDRMPGAWLSSNCAAALILHWQTRPLPRGVEANTA